MSSSKFVYVLTIKQGGKEKKKAYMGEEGRDKARKAMKGMADRSEARLKRDLPNSIVQRRGSVDDIFFMTPTRGRQDNYYWDSYKLEKIALV